MKLNIEQNNIIELADAELKIERHNNQELELCKCLAEFLAGKIRNGMKE